MGILDTIRDMMALPYMAAHGTTPVPFESPYNSPNHLLTVTPPDYTGRITRKTAMSVPAVKRARQIIVGAIARSPLQAVRGDDVLDNQPIWLNRTDGVQSPVFRMTWTIDDLFFYGWSLWGLARDHTGAVIRADRVPYDMWEIDGDGRVLINGTACAPEQYCLIPGPDEGLLESSSVAIRHAEALNMRAQRATDNPAAQILLRQVAGQPLTRPQIDQLVGDWARARRGENGGVAFANQSIEVVELGKAAENLLIEGRTLAATDIARAAGVPAVMIDAAPAAGSTMSYNNVESRNVELIDYALAPYMSAVTGRLGLDDMVPRGTAVRFDVSDLTSLQLGHVRVQDDDTMGDNPNAANS